MWVAWRILAVTEPRNIVLPRTSHGNSGRAVRGLPHHAREEEIGGWETICHPQGLRHASEPHQDRKTRAEQLTLKKLQKHSILGLIWLLQVRGQHAESGTYWSGTGSRQFSYIFCDGSYVRIPSNQWSLKARNLPGKAYIHRDWP